MDDFNVDGGSRRQAASLEPGRQSIELYGGPARWPRWQQGGQGGAGGRQNDQQGAGRRLINSFSKKKTESAKVAVRAASKVAGTASANYIPCWVLQRRLDGAAFFMGGLSGRTQIERPPALEAGV